VREQYGASKAVIRALLNIVQASRAGDHELVSPLEAPRCLLNARISRSRRFATQALALDRLRALARAAGATLNDVVLALSAASLRIYLLEQGALPAAPLVAMVPVAIRAKDELGGGNAVGAILATLATDVADPAERLARIAASTARAKAQLQGMSKAAILQYSALLTAPSMLQVIPGAAGHLRPPFNIVISNVPGPDRPLVLPRRAPRGLVPDVDPDPRPGAQHHLHQLRRPGVLRLHRLPRYRSPPATPRGVYCGEALSELEHAVLHA